MNIGILLALIIIAIILALGLKSRTPELSALISVAVCTIIIGICLSRIRVIIQVLNKLTSHIRIDSTYLIILLKLIGIAYVCEFASGISKEAGYGAIAAQIELLGKLTMLVVSLPVLLQVLETVLGMLS